MIEYLDQLEQDLVEAIQRRQAAGSPLRRRRIRAPRPRLGLVLATALALVALGLAIAANLRESPEPVAPPTPVHRGPAPIPAGTELRVRGTLPRLSVTSWSGAATGPGGGGTLTATGTLTLTGAVNFANGARHTVAFRWTSPYGELDGCWDATIVRRPHGRWVWDGPGHVTTATNQLRGYKGRRLDIAGLTPTTATDHVRVLIRASARPSGRC